MAVKRKRLALSVSNIGFFEADDERVWSLLQKLGYTGLEIAPTRLVGMRPYEKRDAACEKARMLYERYGLRISSMQSIWYGKSGNIFEPKDAQHLWEYTKKAVDFAAALQCSNLVFGNPRQRKMRCGETQEQALGFFADIAAYACQWGTRIALEANPEVYGTNFCNHSREAFDFASKVPGLKVNYDLGTLLTNEESLDVLFEHLDQVNHIHISEPELAPIHVRQVHHCLAQGLYKAGYTGFVSVEMKTQEFSVVERVLNEVAEVFA
ncbi:sugar phosphate isomerase/epimerase family protein [uncultured Ruthenibacterium sp.]|uniref:sugar phosphate isomerase/epimerase family protein n=1 Tax=uncultured Ruthenibacterium sp. TaxID=1905347 RepID=UPI00349E53AA